MFSHNYFIVSWYKLQYLDIEIDEWINEFIWQISISILFTVALLTGFLSIAYVQWAHAFSIDFSGLIVFGDNQGPQGDKGNKGDTGIKDHLDKVYNSVMWLSSSMLIIQAVYLIAEMFQILSFM